MIKKSTFFLLVLVLSGCSFFQHENEVAFVEGDSFDGCAKSCIHADSLNFSERITNKMLNSAVIKPLLQQMVKIRVELMKNETKLDKRNSNAMYEKIIETLLHSNRLRVMTPSSDSYDYTLSVKLSETSKNINDRLMSEKKLELKLFTSNGEAFGDWSETIISY